MVQILGMYGCECRAYNKSERQNVLHGQIFSLKSTTIKISINCIGYFNICRTNTGFSVSMDIIIRFIPNMDIYEATYETGILAFIYPVLS